MAKRSYRRRTGASQRVMQILGILIALSMVLVVLAPLVGGSSRATVPTSTPEPTFTPVPQPTMTSEPTATPGPAVAPTTDSGS